jgi:hypothetical protein
MKRQDPKNTENNSQALKRTTYSLSRTAVIAPAHLYLFLVSIPEKTRVKVILHFGPTLRRFTILDARDIKQTKNEHGSYFF